MSNKEEARSVEDTIARSAMTLALEALRKSMQGNLVFDEAMEAFKALEEALAKQEQRSDSEHLGKPVIGMLEPIGILMKLEGDKHLKLYAMDEQLEQQTVATKENWDGVLHKGIIHSEKLNTTPQPAPQGEARGLSQQKPWVGLTDEDLIECERLADIRHRKHMGYSRTHYARAIEAKLKEKNT